MATFLRTLSYRYQWLYDTISRLAALTVGGETRFRNLALQGLTGDKTLKILDLCCGAGQTTQFLTQYSDNVTGLDISPLAIERAKKNVPQANYVVAPAEKMPLPDQQFDLVHTSAALHEMTPTQLSQIFQEVYRVLKPGGIFTFIDLHQPTNPFFVPSLYTFMFLFETETAWQLIKTDLAEKLTTTGFEIHKQEQYAGGSLQMIQSRKPGSEPLK
ncbi:class I SAM-dependent methyltransferase [Picosynechococcus sp. PCC 8807]|uniref:class I SAM-dependent methyltransferase n=1 Tax=Picosynechococcus sp. PCC 8807 TaxID=195248 RepID=UPI0008107647|nr:class I SAM-dependent methyltransferase [Picosynechococcus sp. PCC 8807]ANV90160.1 SAM-dependent methyltransferase [Picosynechococcus sp. PCC 8807]